MQVISISEVYASGSRRLVAWFLDKLILGSLLSALFVDSFAWTNNFPADWWSLVHFSFTFYRTSFWAFVW